MGCLGPFPNPPPQSPQNFLFQGGCYVSKLETNTFYVSMYVSVYLSAIWGGDIQMAIASGVNVKTVARGRKELLAQKINLGRIRRKGAGRPPLKKAKS